MPHPVPTQSYLIISFADCKSSSLVYQLQCTKRNAFYIKATGQKLSKCMNGHWSICAIVNSDPKVPIGIKSLFRKASLVYVCP